MTAEKFAAKENEQLLKNVNPQEVNSLVHTPRSDDTASGNRPRECLQRFETLEKDIQFTKVCEEASFFGRVYWNVLMIESSSMQRAHTSSCTILGRTTIGPVLQVHIFQFLGNHGIEFQVPSTTTKDRTSWVVTCRGKNRYVEELHLNDPDHNPTSSELLVHIGLERSVAKKREPGSTKMEPSWCIEETHAKQLKIQTNPVYKYSDGGFSIEERNWNDIRVFQQFRGHTFEAEVS